MNDEVSCQLRRRKMSNNPHLPLHLDVNSSISEGDPNLGTPSPSTRLASTKQKSSSSALLDFKNKQQSFDIQVEECEEEEIIIETDDEDDDEICENERPVTPTPIADFAGSVCYTEGPHTTDFLRVKTLETDCYTDVSDADSDGENEN